MIHLRPLLVRARAGRGAWGFARPADWMRAYAEINDFEDHLLEHGIVLVKFWLHLSPGSSSKRFETRAATP